MAKKAVRRKNKTETNKKIVKQLAKATKALNKANRLFEGIIQRCVRNTVDAQRISACLKNR